MSRPLNVSAITSMEALESRRLLSAGDLDPTFGTAGIQVDNMGPAVAMVVQPDGKILVADSNSVERFNADGSRDESFGPLYRDFDIAGMALTPDGKIVLGGTQHADPLPANANPTQINHKWEVQRFNADGTADPSFNGGREADAPFGHFGNRDVAANLALQPDGKVLLDGIAYGDTAALDLVRFNADGTLDTTFGDGGEAGTTNGGYGTFLHAGPLLIRSDGSIIDDASVSVLYLGATPHETVFAADGSLISSGPLPAVSANGPFGSGPVGAAVIRADGTAVRATRSSLTIDNQAVPFEWNALTRNKPSQSALGYAYPGAPHAAVATGDNKVILASGSGGELALARVNPDGSPDLTFGFGGTSVVNPDPFHDGWSSEESLTAMALTPDGSILAAGGIRGRLLLARFQGGSHPLANTPPAATLTTTTAALASDNRVHINLTVYYSGEQAIDASTLTNAAILVTGPNGYAAQGTAQVYSATPATDATPVGIGYTFPTLRRGRAAYGTYTVHLLGGQVRNVAGRTVPASVLGTFPYPAPRSQTYTGISPPTAPSTAAVVAPYGTQYDRHYMTFQVRYDATSGVDLGSVLDAQYGVYGSHDSTTAQYLGAHVSNRGKTVVATYRVGAPGDGNWGGDNNASGSYTIQSLVAAYDKAGYQIGPFGTSTLGNFTVTPYGAQPFAQLLGIDPPAPGATGPVTFRVRFRPSNAGATMNLSSLQSNAVYVTSPTESYYHPTAGMARFLHADVAADGTTVVTYAAPPAPALPPRGPYYIRVIVTGSGISTTPSGPRDSTDAPVPGGLLGVINYPRAIPKRPPAAAARA